MRGGNLWTKAVWLVALIGVAGFATPGWGDLIEVNALVSGETQQIGSIDVSVGLHGDPPNHGHMQAKFTFGKGWGILDELCDFRWFQIITHDDCPVTWNGGQSPVFPFVDPPSGGWDYQPNGDDTEPFYWHTQNEWPTKHVEGVSSSVWDYPTICDGANQKVVWETYLVVRGCVENQFCVLAGFEWSVGRDAGSNPVSTGPSTIANINMVNLNTALNNAGFAGWTAATGCDLSCCVPEPSTLSLVGIGLILVLSRRRLQVALVSRARIV